jgi:hypothetical protein
MSLVGNVAASSCAEVLEVGKFDVLDIPVRAGGMVDLSGTQRYASAIPGKEHPFHALHKIAMRLSNAEEETSAGLTSLAALLSELAHVPQLKYLLVQVIGFVGRCIEEASPGTLGSTDALRDSPAMPSTVRQDPNLQEAAGCDAVRSGAFGSTTAAAKSLSENPRGGRAAYVNVPKAQVLVLLRYLFRTRELCTGLVGMGLACDQTRLNVDDTLVLTGCKTEAETSFHVATQVRLFFVSFGTTALCLNNVLTTHVAFRPLCMQPWRFCHGLALLRPGPSLAYASTPCHVCAVLASPLRCGAGPVSSLGGRVASLTCP